jgi:hypothetical protein
MARTDIAGLLTGVPSGGIDPMAVGGTPAQQRLAFGAQRAQGLQRAARGLMGQSRGTPAEQLQMAMAQLDMSNPDDLRKIAQIQQATGDLAGAAQTAARIKQIQEQESKAEAAGLRASSMSQALEAAGHEDLARQVELGDTDAYKRGLELISPEKGKTSIEDIVDPTTGVTHKVVLSSDGTVLRTVGVSKMPELKSVTLPNGQIVWENKATGTRSEPQDTPEAAAQDQKRVEKLYSDLAAVDNVLVTVSEAKKLAEDESMTTGVFYNLASMPFATDARTLQTKITTLQSTLAFDRLQKMRDESKTGGALGQVSNIELQLLQSALTALDPIVGEEEFIKQLEKVQKHYTNFKKALLGEPLDIDWSRPEYKGKTTVVDGIRYMIDPADPTKVFAIGKEE